MTGWAALHGYPIGILANARGVLFSEEAQKATQFIQLANRADTPLLFLQNTTGYMVGKEYEQGGIIKHGAQMINAVSNSTVPHLTVTMGASYGAGNYGMCGRAYDPRFLFTWPSAKSAVMGPAQLAGVLSIVARQAAEARGPGLRRGRRRQDARVRRGARSRPSRWPRSCPGGCTTTASSTRATPAPCWASRCRPSTARRCRAPTATGCSGCDHVHRAGGQPGRDRPPGVPHLPRPRPGDGGRLLRRGRRAPRTSREADAAVRLPGTAPADTYLRADLLVAAARRAGADAVHPGYGFLSENAAFARAVAAAGLVWVGPPPEAIDAMGSKIEAKRLMAAAGVPGRSTTCAPDAVTAADLPVLIKASAGGGGRGMRVVARAGRPARRARRWPGPRPRPRSATRPCSASPTSRPAGTSRCRCWPTPTARSGPWASASARSSAGTRRSSRRPRRRWSSASTACASSCSTRPGRATKAIGYTGAGTVEFLADDDGRFFFLEMNTRLQVEHPVTECTTGLDLVALQLHVADGGRLDPEPPPTHGHAIEVRLYAEDPAADWAPQSGPLHRFDVPGATNQFAVPGGRAPASASTAASADGSVVSIHYDAMLAKVISWAPTRDPGRPRAGRRPAAGRAARPGHQPRPAGERAAAPGLPGRRHRHRVLRPARPGRAGRPARRRRGRGLAALAAALAVDAAARAGAHRARAASPAGGATSSARPSSAEFDGPAGRHTVAYRHTRDGLRRRRLARRRR